VDLARRAAQEPEAPLPLFVSLGSWLGEEDLAGFLRAQLPEIGWLTTALAEQGRLILLLAGMYGVPTTQRKIKAEQIRVYRGNLPEGTPLIVSCRRGEFIGGRIPQS
jgi:hypothetical protein